MIDLSDGLATDLGHLCDASSVGVRVETAAIPVASGAELADAFAGDDYELCFAAPDPTSVTRAFAASGCAPPTRIGTIVPDGRFLVESDGTERPLPAGGWEHTVP
jgi:thiamine-monophosphate kinase